MFIDSGKVTSKWGKEPPAISTQEELKTSRQRRMEKLIAQGQRRTEEDWTKNIELGLFILNRRLNNIQLLTNGDSSSKRFILFRLFIPNLKSLNLAFLLTNLL